MRGIAATREQTPSPLSAGVLGGLQAIPTLDIPALVTAGAAIKDGIATQSQGWQDVDSPQGQAALDDIGSSLGNFLGYMGNHIDFTDPSPDVLKGNFRVGTNTATSASVPAIDKVYSPGTATIDALAKNMTPAAQTFYHVG